MLSKLRYVTFWVTERVKKAELFDWGWNCCPNRHSGVEELPTSPQWRGGSLFFCWWWTKRFSMLLIHFKLFGCNEQKLALSMYSYRCSKVKMAQIDKIRSDEGRIPKFRFLAVKGKKDCLIDLFVLFCFLWIQFYSGYSQEDCKLELFSSNYFKNCSKK